MKKNSDLIHYSRAGDIFHYRWAIKRCLELLDFNTDLLYVTIEGSQESEMSGECVVDLAEYRKSKSGDKFVEYFQLKHSTVRADKPFTLSLLKDTIIGLSQRFLELTTNALDYKSATFSVITNRLIAPDFKANIEKLANGEQADNQFTKTLKKYTKLDGVELKGFCSSLRLCDSEGNYDEQKYDIHKELAKLSVSKDIKDREKLLVAKVWEKIEPSKSNIIKKEDMLEAFDVTDINDFFPAPPMFEPIPHYIPREEQTSIVSSIEKARNHTIITANGGVGKSILSCNLAGEFTETSIVIAYDCFGNGNYRRPSAKRHGAKHAFIQVINTLAKDGLCDQIIPARNEPDDYWIKAFLNRINEVCLTLLSTDEKALLVIIFDAADNAEMAAEEFGEACFANQLLKESVPQNCRLVFTCRPERLDLLDPPNSINKIELSTFSAEETLSNLQQKYPEAHLEQALEFTRLTDGNPRVQSNALALKSKSLNELLLSFGSNQMTVEDLIERQLEESIARIKDEFPKDFRESIESICTGLATLPPFVPIEVLASAAHVSADSVRSFVADLGRPLWLIDDSVQFRDEPTEKWFQDNYSGSPTEISKYVDTIKPLVEKLPYVAEAIPVLLLKSERFDELVQLALSEDYLPSVSSYDDNQVKVQRLQYAFRAALKASRLYEAAELALRAGEEIAGSERQLDILSNNIDLATQFLTPPRIQELAHRKELQGGWNGSETIYSASLLSSLPGFSGEARSYLRSAGHWLRRYLQQRKKAKQKKERFHEKLELTELLELAAAIYRLNGWEKCVDFLLSWRPPDVFRVTSKFVSRLVDTGEFETIDSMATYGKDNPSFILAITAELMKVGKAPPKTCLDSCLTQIVQPSSYLEKPSYSFDNTGYSLDAYLSFFEACLIHNLPTKSIRLGVNHYYDYPSLYRVADEHQYDDARESLLRFLSIQAALDSNYELKLEDHIPRGWSDDGDSYDSSRELGRAKELVGKLLPWYLLRAKILAGKEFNISEGFKHAHQASSKIGYSAYREHEPAPYEIAKIKFQNVLLYRSDCTEVLNAFVSDYKENKLKTSFFKDLYYLRVSCRNEKLLELGELIEASCAKTLTKFDVEESPESYSENYIKLARAVLSVGPDDAGSYFDEALIKAANFGQESVARWEALTATAKRSAEDNLHDPELAHRYMRCAEMIGDSLAREKHWDRNDAVATCFQLSPESAFAISNRWKERGVGWSDRQMYPLAHSAIDSKLATSASMWSLSAFTWEFGLVEFFSKCLSLEPSKDNQQQILNHLVRDLRINGTTGTMWEEISNLASQYGLHNEELNDVKLLSGTTKPEISAQCTNHSRTKQEQDESELWFSIYGHFDILTPTGFREAYKTFDSRRSPGEPDKFWSGCFQKVTSRRLITFLKIITEADLLNFFDIHSAFEKIPSAWKEKTSVVKAWDNLIEYLAARFPNRFTQGRERDYLIKHFILTNSTHKAIRQGVLKGLSNSVDIESASALFSFVHYSASKLSILQAKKLVESGLSRLESFLDEDYADGNWSTDNSIPENVTHALSCYIYANLGSPYPEERWRAVHAVLRLYDLNCQTEISLLIECYSCGIPKSYIPTKYKFYDLHAKLYLLVALTRGGHKSPELLLKHKDFFSKIALNRKQGILFQYYAKQICLEIERHSPDSYPAQLIESIKKVCVTQYTCVNESKYCFHTESKWHKAKLLPTLPDIRFGYDFENNWCRPLGRVFGVSGSQVQDLVKDILTNQWGISFDSSHIPDPRSDLWKSQRNSYEVFNSRYSYPKIDNFTFYISYHLLLEVASRLLESMPVLHEEENDISAWDEWLKEHLILNNNRMLLSEYRNSMPIERRGWVQEKDHEDWRWQITASDFIDELIVTEDLTTWLNVGGKLSEYKDGRKERISFTSILVPKKVAQSLLNTVTDFESHTYDCYLFNYCVDEHTPPNHPFYCIKWLSRNEENNDIESKDPFVGEIDARPFKLSHQINEVFEVTYSDDQKSCFLEYSKSICLKNKYWSDDKPLDSDTYVRNGSYALASLEFLELICERMNVEIAIQVNIDRSYTSSSMHRNNNDELGYIPGYSKTFLLSKGGQLRDTRKGYQLR
ncbi:hypothetical protein [Pseudoalteromonas ardens]|uniref:hypothetical protein n=1 Tax=Pseudoalteromonas ardens TaxID=3048490 RepID=UPI0024C468BB|nr:hypothetical protein [Pseudoalteromonas sp. R96]MDK1313649.1 hypothetical protein [Pseudoalteromonas sp. R96]